MSKNYAAKDSGTSKYRPANLTTTRVDNDNATQQTQHIDKQLQTRIDNEQDTRFGYARYTEGPTRTAYMYNMYPCTIYTDNTEYSAMDMYFIQADGQTFKASTVYQPYFLIQVDGQSTTINECESFLLRQFSTHIVRIEHCTKIDLAQNNHLTGIQQLYLKLLFHNEDNMKHVRRQLLPVIEQNRIERAKHDILNNDNNPVQRKKQRDEILTHVIDIREYDIAYDQRIAIDLGYRCGLWYDITPVPGEQSCSIVQRKDILEKPALKVCAWDIETSKEPLKFPDAQNDPIIMISYMIDTQGYLLVNRSIVSQDIDSFAYNPKPGEYDGPFDVINCTTEMEMLQYFFKHIRDEHIHIMTTYNGDYFDFPYVEQRAAQYGLELRHEIGMWKKAGMGKGKASNKQENEYLGRFTVHLDCKHWVDRDSYLPQGSRGLKAVTKAKLKYEPVEMDYEDIVPWSIERPQELATYSVSDAVATYYLYDTYVHNFIFSLCTIIPSNPNDVLRFGSGTLCELLLMVQAYTNNIICPNKQTTELTQFYKGHLLDTETYIGGFVEACEAGIFRSDLPTDFYCQPQRIQSLIDNIDDVLQFVLTTELHSNTNEITNYDEIKQQIITQLQALLHKPKQHCKPMIYHLDVGAMYPNIILTNRLQPMAIVNDTVCASCDYNRPGNNCQRSMEWKWRGRYLPATRSEYEQIKQQIEIEAASALDENGVVKQFQQLSLKQKSEMIKKRVKQYGHTVYKKQIIESEENRTSTICQRENSFYVDTVRAFRDRRYDYKALSKKAKNQLDVATTELDIAKAKDLCLLYDSLQLAHKCILNSFYGYVMRKGARWYSMAMAGIVTLTGAQLIQDATAIVRDIGRPLELDTDGIWCILPSTFPDTYAFTTHKNKQLKFNYSCALLNNMIHTKYTNAQYQTLTINPVTNKPEYVTEPQCSIFFELDGPYRAMILPSGLEDGQMLKKRYAVFNFDGSIAELKGFELKRRGELQIIKTLQEDIFKNGCYLEGQTLSEAYNVVGKRANHWLDILYNHGCDLEDIDLFNQIGESKNLSEELTSYGDKKLVSVTALKRLGEFLGENSISGKNLSVKYVIIKYPADTDVSQRAVPIKIFDANDTTKMLYLRKWTKQNNLYTCDVRELLDWQYYIDRLNKAIQKIITIPAAFQYIDNPVPRCIHPEWLKKRVNERSAIHQQQKLSTYFTAVPNVKQITDIESLSTNPLHKHKLPYQPVKQLYIEESKEVEVIEQKKANEPVDPLTLVTAEPNSTTWIQQQKLLWKQIKQNTQLQTQQQSSFGGFNLNKKAKLNTQSHNKNEIVFDIVSIECNTKINNLYYLYVLINHSTVLTRLQYKHNPVFYLNCYNDTFLAKQQYFTYKPVTTKVLPYNKPTYMLYECQLTDEHTAFNIQQYIIQHYNYIENVYSHNIDPIDLFVLTYGNTVKLSNHNILNYNKHIYTNGDLSPIEHQSAKYLTPYITDKHYTVVYIYQLIYKNRGILACHVEAQKILYIYSINYTEQNKDMEQSIYINEFVDSITDISYQNIQFNVQSYRSRNAALKDMKSVITESLNDTTLILLDIESTQQQSFLTDMTVLSQQPKIWLPHSTQKHIRTNDIFASINWYEQCIKQLYVSLFDYNKQIQQQYTYSKFGRVPLCQTSMNENQLNDILFGRTLLANNYLLWNNQLDTITETNYFATETQLNIKQNQPTLQRCICMEFKLGNVLINAVENYILLYELYNKMNVTDIGLLKLFKQFIHEYVLDVTTKQCKLSELLLTNLYTWYKQSKYYDITLYAKLVELISMCLNQLTLHCEKLGSTVVCITLHKLIIASNRYAENHCIAYIKSLLNSITNKDKFFWLNVEPLRMYHNLLYIDAQNYGGVLVRGQNDTTDDVVMNDSNKENTDDNIDTDDTAVKHNSDKYDVVAHWNIAEYLPQHAEQYFILTITEFLLQPNTYLQSHILHSHTDKPLTPTEQIEQLTTYLTEQVDTHYTRILMERVKELQLQYPSYNNTTEQCIDFPLLPGSYLPLNNTALEFIKMICYCMSLDTMCNDAVNRMRELLLRQVQVKSFSSTALYKSPCITYILYDVQCSNCHICTDIDLCRDNNIVDSVQYNDNNELVKDIEWCCENCQYPYDIGSIELQLIDIVHKYVEKYQVQDLRCNGCQRIKNNNLQQYCTCSGQYSTTYSRDEYMKQLLTFGNIGRYYQLHRLQDTVQFLQAH